MSIVYQHRRKDTNEVFYIGIGKSKDRAYQKGLRNPHWYSVVDKVGYEVDILIEGLSWEDACVVDSGLISDYGRSDLGLGPLVNMTDGGDGTLGIVDTPERRLAKRQFMLENNPMNFEESRKKVAESKIGKKRFDMQGDLNPNFKPGVYEKQREGWANFLNSEEGRTYREDLKVRYGSTLGSEESKLKSKETRISNIQSKSKEEKSDMTKVMNAKNYSCEYCGVTTNSGNYKRWHGRNCKQLKNK
jgi:hypothetical protein